VSSIAAKIGCRAQLLNDCVKKAEVDIGVRAGLVTEVAEKLKTLERENREFRQANEMLRKASALPCACCWLCQGGGLGCIHANAPTSHPP